MNFHFLSQHGTIEIDKKFFTLTRQPEGEIALFLLEGPVHGLLTIKGKGTTASEFTDGIK